MLKSKRTNGLDRQHLLPYDSVSFDSKSPDPPTGAGNAGQSIVPAIRSTSPNPVRSNLPRPS
ncbi:uncharacterized protein BDV14DRAFT_184978 [Aspergillus stella-maris]|uniref:uncharacterized protein n=1 Tax=Aspergillus stella-maris TaxID=1810926 RepID=UPI003CCDB7E6